MDLGFEKIHAIPKAITSAMQLYFSGESLRKQKFLKMHGVNAAGPVIRDLSERKNSRCVAQYHDRHICLSNTPYERLIEEHTVHAYGREPVSLILKKDQSGPVIYSSEAREADTYGQTLSDVASTPTHLDMC